MYFDNKSSFYKIIHKGQIIEIESHNCKKPIDIRTNHQLEHF